ncbi:hypothetical protein [Rhizobium glycinendophyticum]|uniref:Uncharacterized protein n=1 Tax=Rhizobium glycinendophyticum TaxID=2589807 RepID=A0A504TWM7_9HYPH|nr:hypothetical protein [Rhizobium glycinendophyticum]TPP07118.1 hypothetical protein FJQ55_15805 [Rhizobium glycinendophyticum]
MKPQTACSPMTLRKRDPGAALAKQMSAQLLPDSLPLHPNEDDAVQSRVSPYLATADHGDDADCDKKLRLVHGLVR